MSSVVGGTEYSGATAASPRMLPSNKFGEMALDGIESAAVNIGNPG